MSITVAIGPGIDPRKVNKLYKTIIKIKEGNGIPFQNAVNKYLEYIFSKSLEMLPYNGIHARKNEKGKKVTPHITDAVFRIRIDCGQTWEEIKNLFRTYVIVVECKNYND